jgi:hypothetical protein
LKAYGLRIIINVNGNAGEFSVLPVYIYIRTFYFFFYSNEFYLYSKLMITIGAGFGLLGFSVLIADCILLNFTQKKKLFQKLKAVDAKEEFEKNLDIVKVNNEKNYVID